jgi:hypothetical protein
LKYADVSRKELKFLDVTSLTVEEFNQLVPAFEEVFQERMKEWRLDGKRRLGRKYTTYVNCPLPTPEDRLLFILVYLKTNVLQVIQGDMFGMPQNKANQWIQTLLPVLQQALRKLGDAPARSMEELAQRLNFHTMVVSSEGSERPSAMGADSLDPEAAHLREASSLEPKREDPNSPPLFAMMERNDVSSVLKMRMRRPAIIAARKRAIP